MLIKQDVFQARAQQLIDLKQKYHNLDMSRKKKKPTSNECMLSNMANYVRILNKHIHMQRK